MIASSPPPESSPDLPTRLRPIRSVAIIGLGLIGGSLARDLNAASDLMLISWDQDAETRAEAQAAGIPVAETLADCVAGEPDLIVLAVPLAAMRAVCVELAPLVAGHTLVTDVGSVKGPVRETVVASGLGERYVGSHPMAGTEATGFAASTPGMFQNAAWVVTVAASAHAASTHPASAHPAVADSAQVDCPAELEAALVIAELVTRVLGVRVYVLSDDQHDEAVALISHLPHVLAAELLGLAALSPVRDVALALAAGSFRDGTRVAGTNPARTEAMVTGNAAWVAPLVEKAATRLQTLAAQLRAGDDVSDFFAPHISPLTAEVPAPDASEPGAADPGASDPDVPTSDIPRTPDTARAPETPPASETVTAAAMAPPALRTLLLDVAANGRAIRAVDLRTPTITLAP
ncbi:prephenate dehydrogenase/arogenate dehydrogenase family protein [Homoserinimonas sp. OAct 916]|uniref:prephenate dehydrogenase n=1 Tax=Homoserinimonas sp. OAct 916 TaxID=2211450 RepID=UPI000DBE880F|nr:prephenate dehydrogenase/arogenate dehydrogenase family protein [Homoserinimonas sp. OAct 916]